MGMPGSESGSNRDQWFARWQNFSDFDCCDSRRVQSPRQFCAVFRGYGNQQPSRSLRIEQHRLDLFADAILVTDRALGKLTIGFQPTWNMASADAVQCAFEQR